MAWDDSDDDDAWDKADLTLPGANAKKEEDTWSDEEGHDAHLQPTEEEVKQAAPAPPPAPPKEKTGLAKKIEEREKREAEEAERLRKMSEETAIEITDDMDEATKEKLRRKQAEEASDLANAVDAFGLDTKPRPAAAASGSGEFEAFAPKTDKDFEKLAELMNKKLSSYEGTKQHLVCLKALLRAATKETTSDEMKELSQVLSVIQNAKLAADRDKDKTKKKLNAKKGKFNDKAMNARANDMDGFGEMGSGGGWSGGGGGRDDDYDFM